MFILFITHSLFTPLRTLIMSPSNRSSPAASSPSAPGPPHRRSTSSSTPVPAIFSERAQPPPRPSNGHHAPSDGNDDADDQ